MMDIMPIKNIDDWEMRTAATTGAALSSSAFALAVPA